MGKVLIVFNLNLKLNLQKRVCFHFYPINFCCFVSNDRSHDYFVCRMVIKIKMVSIVVPGVYMTTEARGDRFDV